MINMGSRRFTRPLFALGAQTHSRPSTMTVRHRIPGRKRLQRRQNRSLLHAALALSATPTSVAEAPRVIQCPWQRGTVSLNQDTEEPRGSGARVVAATVLVAAVCWSATCWSCPRSRTRSRRGSSTPASSSRATSCRSAAARSGWSRSIELAPDGSAEVELAHRRPADRARCGEAPGRRSASRRCRASPTATSTSTMPPGESQEQIEDGGVIALDRTRPPSSTSTTSSRCSTTSTKQGLRNVVEGFADSYEGEARAANVGWKYLNPSLVGAQRLFEELSYDRAALQSFVVSNAKLVNDVAARRGDVSKLVDRLAVTLDAIGTRGRLAALGDQPAAAVHAARQHDLREPARDARRPRPADRRVAPGHAEAARRARRAVARSRATARPTVRRPVGPRALRRHAQRPDRPVGVRPAVPRRDHARGSATTARSRDGSFAAGTKSLRVADAAVRLPAPVRGRPDGLVRRLQPLRHLRRLRVGLAREHQRVRLRVRSTVSCSCCPEALRTQVFQEVADARPAQPLPGLDRAPGRRRVQPVPARRRTSTATRPRSRPGR